MHSITIENKHKPNTENIAIRYSVKLSIVRRLEVCYIMATESHRTKGGLPLLFFTEGITALQTKERRAIPMYVTYTDLIQIGIFIVALVGLCYTIFKGRKK